MRTHFLVLLAAAIALSGPCVRSSAAGAPAFEQSEFERMDIPALSRTVKFKLSDWQGDFTGNMLLSMSAKSKGEENISFSVHGSSRATFISGTVISETDIDRLSFAMPGDSNEYSSNNSPLATFKVVSSLDGNIVSSEMNFDESLSETGNSDVPVGGFRIPKEDLQEYIDGQFGFLKNGLSPGDEMGYSLHNPEIEELLRPCGFSEKPPPVRAVGEYKGAIIGRTLWHPRPTKICRAQLDITYVIDAIDGRPLKQIFRGSLDLVDPHSEPLHFSVVAIYAPDFVPTSGISHTEYAEPGPSFQKCAKSPKSVDNISYPEASLDAREAGTTELKIKVGKQGGVEEVRVAKSSGFPRLDEWAAAGAHIWRFDPSACAGLWIEVPVEFQLPE